MFSQPSTKGELPELNFAVQRTLLKYIGIPLHDSVNKVYALYSLSLLFVVISYSYVEFSELLINLDDFDVVTNIIMHLLGFYIGILKALILFFNSDRLKVLLDMMGKVVSRFDNDDFSKAMIRKCVFFSNVQTVFCLAPLNLIFTVSSLVTLLRKLSNGHFSNLPFTQLTVIDVTTNGLRYVLVWTHQTAAFIVAAVTYLTAEVLITVVLIHLYVQIKILKNYITRNIMSCATKDSQFQRNVLKQIVLRHMDICDLANQTQDAFSSVLLIIFASDVLIICFSAFHGSLYPLTDMQCLRDIGIALSIIVKTLMVCYWGNEVCIESETITDACYEAHFEDTDRLFQKGLLVIVLKCQKPIIIAAGKLTPVSLDTFIWIVRTSYSYFTVLQSRNHT